MPPEVKIAPSILAADFGALRAEIAAVAEAGADYIHIDVMDGHFVPNLTIGPDVVRALKKDCPLPLDVHLMIAPVDPYIEAFAQAGADILTIHPEAGPHLHRSLQAIRQAGCRAGLALNPATAAQAAAPVLDMLDLVLVMSVNPGFGGQRFLDSQLGKIAAVREMIERSGRAVALEVDGGIDAQSAPRAIAAGATILVAGTAIFSAGRASYAEAIARLRARG